jgi:TrmH family RNA methyltransferase
MARKIVVLENIRSAYNVWNIIRTADSLGRDVWMSGYTPWPDEQPKVKKTSLGAEENVWLKRFDDALQAINFARENDFDVLAWEITPDAIDLAKYEKSGKNIMLILWNEVDGVQKKTLETVDAVVYIPMHWIKESMNVGQSSAIFMRELRNN